LILCEDFIDNEGDGTVARDIAGGTEIIHHNVESNHQRLLIGTEAQN